MTSSLRALLTGIVDYAGLFPPAALSMADTVRNYDRYRRGADAWMLGRLIVPAGRLDEFRESVADIAGADDWRLSAIVGGDFASDLDRVVGHNDRGAALVDSIEVRADSEDAVAAVAGALPEKLVAYIEVPAAPDPRELIKAIARVEGRRVRAKIRTGGVTTDAFPSVGDVARFVRACYGSGVAFKATAGLHHPLRGAHALTYENDSPRGVMHGFLNVFVGAALCYNGLGGTDAPRILGVERAGELTFTDAGVSWADYRASVGELETARRRLAVSFGSCSFEEPVADLRGLGLL